MVFSLGQVDDGFCRRDASRQGSSMLAQNRQYSGQFAPFTHTVAVAHEAVHRAPERNLRWRRALPPRPEGHSVPARSLRYWGSRARASITSFITRMASASDARTAWHVDCSKLH